MAKSKKLDSILVSLDCLLDTRLATVSKINLDIANKLLDGDDYHTRDQDVFVGIDKEYFKEVYKNRDIETLKKSSLTNIVPLLRHLVSKLKEQSIVRPFHDGGNIVVNMYPYKLTIDEQDEICAAIAVWMQGLAPVSRTPNGYYGAGAGLGSDMMGKLGIYSHFSRSFTARGVSSRDPTRV